MKRTVNMKTQRMHYSLYNDLKLIAVQRVYLIIPIVNGSKAWEVFSGEIQ